MGIHWVAIQAKNGGFDAPALISVSRENLNLTMTLPNNVIKIDLTPLNRAAEKIQRFECLAVPENLRFFGRFACFVADSISNSIHQQKEQEFYKNAGLV